MTTKISEAVKILESLSTGERGDRKPSIEELEELLSHNDVNILPNGKIIIKRLTIIESNALQTLIDHVKGEDRWRKGKKVTDEGCGVPFKEGVTSCVKCGLPIKPDCGVEEPEARKIVQDANALIEEQGKELDRLREEKDYITSLNSRITKKSNELKAKLTKLQDGKA